MRKVNVNLQRCVLDKYLDKGLDSRNRLGTWRLKQPDSKPLKRTIGPPKKNKKQN